MIYDNFVFLLVVFRISFSNTLCIISFNLHLTQESCSRDGVELVWRNSNIWYKLVLIFIHLWEQGLVNTDTKSALLAVLNGTDTVHLRFVLYRRWIILVLLTAVCRLAASTFLSAIWLITLGYRKERKWLCIFFSEMWNSDKI